MRSEASKESSPTFHTHPNYTPSTIMMNYTRQQPQQQQQYQQPEEKTIQVPPEAIAFCIGKGGSTIAPLREQFKCRVEFSNDYGTATVRPFSRTPDGQPIDAGLAADNSEQMALAIQGLVAEYYRQKQQQPARQQQYQQPQQQQQYHSQPMNGNRMVAVPPAAIGFCIGKGGSTIAPIREQFQCRIDFDKENGCASIRPMARDMDPQMVSYNVSQVALAIEGLVVEWQRQQQQRAMAMQMA